MTGHSQSRGTSRLAASDEYLQAPHGGTTCQYAQACVHPRHGFVSTACRPGGSRERRLWRWATGRTADHVTHRTHRANQFEWSTRARSLSVETWLRALLPPARAPLVMKRYRAQTVWERLLQSSAAASAIECEQTPERRWPGVSACSSPGCCASPWVSPSPSSPDH
jgi:hypothetical protein